MKSTMPNARPSHSSRVGVLGSREKEKKVRFEDNERSFNLPERSSRCLPNHHEGVTLKDKKTGEILPFGEHKVTPTPPPAAPESEEIRLKGKLRWLFEQDRMFWESNDTKLAVSGDTVKGTRLAGEERDRAQDIVTLPSDPQLVTVKSNGKPRARGECFRRSASSKKSTNVQQGKLNVELHDKGPKSRKEPKQSSGESQKLNYQSPIHSSEFKDAKASWDFEDQQQRPGAKTSKDISHTATSTGVKMRRSASLNLNSRNSKDEKARKVQSKTKPGSPPHQKVAKEEELPKLLRLPEVVHHLSCVSVDDMAEVSELDLGGPPDTLYFTDYEDAGGDGANSEEDEADERTKVGAAAAAGENMEDKTTFLIAKCDLLAKEKDIAVRKWKRSCVEIDQAAQMTQALRSAIETLLEVSVGAESATDFASKRTTLEEHTRALKIRMEKLRRKSAELHPHPEPEVDLFPNALLQGRIETLKKSSEGRGLGSPEIPRDTEHKVEDLKARLEKLMLATNSRVTDQGEHVMSRPREKKKKPPKETTVQPEKAELKMRGWFNSLSAELSAELTPHAVQPNGSVGSTREPSYEATPVNSKQVSPLHPSSHHHLEDTASTHSSEETKIRVIHKIAEEVRAESEQWYQVQELLQRVGEDMKSLQEACSTWEQRALLAEAQVATLQNEEQERRERAKSGDQKIVELQTELVRLRDTVDEVRIQLGSVDPSRWFEAANKYGYAFVPVMKPNVSGSYSFRDYNAEAAADEARGSSTTTDDINNNSNRSRHKSAAAAPDCSDTCAVDNQWQPSSSRDKIRPRRNQKLPSVQWANEIAKAEEEEIFQSKLVGSSEPQLSSMDLLRTDVVVEDLEEEELQMSTDISSRPEKLTKLRLGTKPSDDLHWRHESKEAIPTSPVSKDSTGESGLPVSTRPPLKVVLGNVAPSKENKKPL